MTVIKEWSCPRIWLSRLCSLPQQLLLIHRRNRLELLQSYNPKSHTMAGTPLKYVSKLSGTWVLIIGGTSGIGFAVAEAALEHGASVILSGSNPTRLADAIHRLKTSYPDRAAQVSGQTCDLSQPQSIESNLSALFDAAAAAATRPIDHIVFTAGDPLKIVPISESIVETIQSAGTVRFLGPLMVAKLAPKYLAPGPASSITLTSGTNGAKPIPGWTVQAAWNTSLEGMTRGLAVDLKPVRVNLVSPGAVHTERFGDVAEDKMEEFLRRMREATTTGEVGRPEDVAEAYLYAMKDRFLSGTIISSDGGRLLA